MDGHDSDYFATADHNHDGKYSPINHNHEVSDITGLQGEIDTLKTSVTSGKAAIASAVTDKGVQTAADAAFQTIAENIGKISVGMVNFESGTIVISNQDAPITIAGLKNKNNYVLLVSQAKHHPDGDPEPLGGIVGCCSISGNDIVVLTDKNRKPGDSVVIFDKSTGTLTPPGTFYGHWACYNSS